MHTQVSRMDEMEIRLQTGNEDENANVSHVAPNFRQLAIWPLYLISSLLVTEKHPLHRCMVQMVPWQISARGAKHGLFPLWHWNLLSESCTRRNTPRIAKLMHLMLFTQPPRNPDSFGIARKAKTLPQVFLEVMNNPSISKDMYGNVKRGRLNSEVTPHAILTELSF